jgi:hypothetical protein
VTSDGAQLLYLRWLAQRHPIVYERAVKPIANLGGLGWINFVVQAVAAVGGAVLAKRQKKKAAKIAAQTAAAEALEFEKIQKETTATLLQVNTLRAQRGLPPINERGEIIGGSTLPIPPQLAPFYSPAQIASAPAGDVLGNINPLWLIGGGVLALTLLVRR